VPLILLATGAVFVGAAFADAFVGHHWQQFWNGAIVNAPHNHIMHDVHEVPGWVPLAPTVVGVLGIGLAYVMYMLRPELPARVAAAVPGLYRFLLNKWYFDEFYDRIFVRPARRLAYILWKTGDARIIDGMPNGAASVAVDVSRGAVRLQTGRVANYAFAMIIGLVLFASILLFGAVR
jgi:NADH-quinone oxidoreductase subunit L